MFRRQVLASIHVGDSDFPLSQDHVMLNNLPFTLPSLKNLFFFVFYYLTKIINCTVYFSLFATSFYFGYLSLYLHLYFCVAFVIIKFIIIKKKNPNHSKIATELFFFIQFYSVQIVSNKSRTNP